MNPFYEKRENPLQISRIRSLSFPEHLHDQVEMLYVLDGEIEVTVMDKHRLLGKGDCAVIFPGQIHSYHSGCDNEILLLIFESSVSGPYMQSFRKYQPFHPFLHADTLHPDVRYAFQRLNDPKLQTDTAANAARGQTDDALSCAWLQVALAHLFPCLELHRENRSEDTELTHRLVLFIMEHYREPLSLDLLAKELHVNKYYISHVFSDRLKRNFRQYLNRIRLEYAMQAMRSSAMPLTQVWEEAGFESQRSFNRAFRAVMGMTPMQYRKLL